MHWAVPVFLMLTGALLLGRETTYPECLKKYARRTALALLLFGLPYAAIKTILENGFAGFDSLALSLRAFVEGNGFAHMWYLYALLGIYMVLPVLQAAVSRMKEQHFRYLLGALLIFSMILPTIGEITGIEISFSVPFTWVLFYLFAGYYIHALQPTCKKGYTLLSIVILAGVIIAINCLDFYPEELTAYMSPLTAVLAVQIFRLFRGGISGECSEKTWRLDRLCFGVYLIHPVFIQLTYRILKITPVSFHAYPLAAMVFFLIFTICSFIGSWILNRIGFLRKYVL